MELVLCTGNPGKVAELRALLPDDHRVVGLAELGLSTDLPETSDTLQGNALQKARHAFAQCGRPCVADDTGLEVDALHGAPGVRSARYAGEAKDAAANMRKLLDALVGAPLRTARFRTVLAFVDGDKEHCFEGTVEGTITHGPLGTGGFGYDPIFLPEGSSLTFAQMDAEAKNRISHRARAMEKLLAYLREVQRPR
ncbi:MAG: RdgB/HAM1 family non-canonical purine NTP pyrophosphatase [Flavobacteriales bacterium]|nr:RdgB/HAM1 family non-canonical purine NTP pyrophosphatase [Flavobacteriales bacterium]MBP6698097.1 RdgB/HAM1 family non-canonical purine NTP pyrophosphatase [Flavobacteriales bacterium]